MVEGRAYISGSVGPTGAIVKPYGDTEPEVLAEGFRRQIGALVDAGADLICVETMIDLTEARLAVEAARARSADIPIIATMTFDTTPRGYFTMMGSSIEQCCATLVAAGANVVGSNCGNGIEKMLEIAREFASHASVPIAIQSNAGMPELRDGELVYAESPDFMAARVGRADRSRREDHRRVLRDRAGAHPRNSFGGGCPPPSEFRMMSWVSRTSVPP